MAYFKLTIRVIKVFVGLTLGPVLVSCQIFPPPPGIGFPPGFPPPPGIGTLFGGLPSPGRDPNTAEREVFLIQDNGLLDGGLDSRAGGGFGGSLGGGLTSLLLVLLLPLIFLALTPPAAPAAPAAQIQRIQLQPIQLPAATGVVTTNAPSNGV